MFSMNNTAASLFAPFKHGVHVTSSVNCPMSAYFPLVISLKSTVGAVLDAEEFDTILGAGAAESCKKVLEPRWNLNGEAPAGRKVGFLDKYQLWTFLCDPYSRQLSLDFEVLVAGGLNGIVADMLKWAIPGDSDEDKASRSAMKIEFNAFHTGTGKFALSFDDDTSKHPEGHVLTIPDVQSWVSTTGGHESRLAWFLVNDPKSRFFLEIAKPLLSVRITGSMTVERVAKPLKNSVLTTDRATLGTGKADMLLRAGLNLRFLREAKDQLQAAASGGK